MVHITLGFDTVDTVEKLFFANGGKRCHGENLCLTSGEKTAAVCAGKYAHLGCERTDLIHPSAVDTLSFVKQPSADNLLLELVKAFVDHCLAVGIILCKRFVDLFVNGLECGVAHALVVGVESDLDFIADHFGNAVEHFVIELERGIFEFGLADFRFDAFDEFAKRDDFLVSLHDGFVHGFVIDFVGARFDHDDLLCGAGDSELEIADRSLGFRRVDDYFAVHKSDEYARDRAVPRNVGNGKRYGSTDHCGNFGGAVGIDGHDGERYHDVVAEILREERADRSVDNAGSEYRVFGRPAFAAVPASGDLSGGVKPFFVIDGKGKEVDTVSRSGGHGRVCKNCGFAVANKAGATGELSELAGFDNERPSGELVTESFVIFEHFLDPFVYSYFTSKRKGLKFNT